MIFVGAVGSPALAGTYAGYGTVDFTAEADKSPGVNITGGKASVTWTLVENLPDVRTYTASGTISGNLSPGQGLNCAPVPVTGAIATDDTLVLYTGQATWNPGTYSFVLTLAERDSLTTTCTDGDGGEFPVEFPNLLEVAVGGVCLPDYTPRPVSYTDPELLEGTWECPSSVFSPGTTAQWTFHLDGSVASDTPLEDPCLKAGSVIGCENQSLGEVVPIAGTAYTLHYQSSRMAGTTGANAIARAWARDTGGWTPHVWHRYDPAEHVLFLGTGAFRNSDSLGQTVVRTPTNGYLIPSEDGDVVYEFNNKGIHLRTRHGLTGAALLTFARDASGRLLKIIDGNGNLTKFNRDADGLLTGIVSPYGLISTVTLTNGLMTALRNPAGQTIKATYTGKGLLTSFTNRRGKVSYFTYDTDGRLTRDKDAAGAVQTLARAGSRVTHTSPMGRATTYDTVFQNGGAIERTLTEPTGLTRTYGHAPLADTLILSNGMTHETSHIADPRFGDAAKYPGSYKTSTPAGIVRTLAQQRAATLSDATDPFSVTRQVETANLNGKISTSVFDKATLTFTETSPLGRETTTEVDHQGRALGTDLPGLNPIGYAYDSRGRLKAVTVGTTNPRITQLGYNAQGYLSQTIDSLGRTQTLTRDKLGRLLQQVREDGSLVKFAYDAGDNPTRMINPAAGVYLFTYTDTDLLSSLSLPAVGGVTPRHTYAYNRDRQLTRHTLPDGGVINYAYSATGRLFKISFGSDVWTYRYNLVYGYLKSLDAPGGINLDFKRDGDLPTEVAWSGPVAGKVGLAYDNDLRLKSVRVNGRNPVTYAYEGDGGLTKAGAMTLRRKATNGLLLGSTLEGVTDTYTYNGFGELTRYQASYNDTPLLTFNYVYDTLGRITKVTESVLGGANKVATYQYDALGRISAVGYGATTRTYAYDDNGNRVSLVSSGGENLTGVYDAQDKLLSYGTSNHTYSANGERIGVSQGASTTRYEYDALGNLAAAVLPSGQRIDYLIDGMGLRIGKKVDGTLKQAFLYQSSLKPVAELNGAGVLTSRFVYANRRNVPDYMVRGGVTYRILTDHLGSPRLVVNTATGAVAQRLAYDEFGRVTQNTRPSFQPFGFGGGLYDRDTGLVHFGAREFDPRYGRWTAPDPSGFEGGSLNLYAYVDNDPVNYVDEGGLERIKVGSSLYVNAHSVRVLSEARVNAQPILELRAGDKVVYVGENKHIPANGGDPAQFTKVGLVQARKGYCAYIEGYILKQNLRVGEFPPRKIRDCLAGKGCADDGKPIAPQAFPSSGAGSKG